MAENVLYSIRCWILVGLAICSGCTKKITMVSLMEEMTARENLTFFPVKTYNLHQFSSYNRESVSPEKEGWFANMICHTSSGLKRIQADANL